MLHLSTRGRWASIVWFALVGLVPAFTACDCDDGGLQSGKPLIQVLPEVVDFGALNVGDVAEQVVTISNTGSAALNLQGITIEGDSAFVTESLDGQSMGEVAFPVGLAIAGATGTSERALLISFTAAEEMPYDAELVIDSNADNQPQVRIPLSGSGSVPDIDVSPVQLNFGGVGLNSSSSLNLTVTNQGEAPLVIGEDDVSLESGDQDAPFIWIRKSMLLTASEQDTLEVIYRPSEVRLDGTGQVIPDVDALLIASNDPDENPVRVPLEGYVSDNLPPVTAVKILEVTKLDGTQLADVCAAAPVDTIRFEGRALDPEGLQIQGGNLHWDVEAQPVGSTRQVSVPSQEDQRFWPTFKADLSGDYTICLAASDPEGNRSTYDPDLACDCEVANAAEDFSCPCVRFSAFPREDIRIELTWDILGPDLDLHLVAPAGDYCSPTRECRFNPLDPEDPTWTRTACVDNGAITTCRTPNCDPVPLGCLVGQDCYDDGTGPACWWQTCSGTDCYWNARRPDWGVPADTTDDPVLAIDCTGQCRAENINLNNPVVGIYTVMVNYYEYSGNTTATVRIYFKGDVVPTAEFTAEMTETCDRWNVALIDWVDPNDHPVTSLGDSHSLSCCD